MAAHCEAVGGIGWIFGHLIDGVQAEFARVPYAETSVHLVPEGVTDEQVLFLADILPTGYEIGVQNGRVKPGDTIAVVGAGPVGLAAMMTGAIAGAGRIIAVDTAPSRLKHAREFGATHTVVGGDDAEREILELTGGGGVDVAMEAVGVPATFDLCTRIVRAGRHGGEHRRPRRADDAAPRGALDQEHHDHDRASSAARRSRRCSSSRATAGSRPRSSARTTSRSARSRRPTTCSPRRASTTR